MALLGGAAYKGGLLGSERMVVVIMIMMMMLNMIMMMMVTMMMIMMVIMIMITIRSLMREETEKRLLLTVEVSEDWIVDPPQPFL